MLLRTNNLNPTGAVPQPRFSLSQAAVLLERYSSNSQPGDAEIEEIASRISDEPRRVKVFIFGGFDLL